ncbi:MAG: M15 family metallopeptidase [Bacteroidota bacterium]
MPKLQSPNYICKTKDEVIKEFGEPAVAWQLSSIEKIEKLFGTCEASDFKETKTKLIELPGFGEKGDVTKKIRMHQSLEKLLVSAFTEIKNANLGYILWDGHVWGHSFRYKKNSTTITYIKTRSEYSHLKEAMNDDDAWDSWGWAIKAAAYDAQNGKLGDLVEVRNGKKVTKKSLLSNHAFGTAIDINSGYNAFSKSARFDMNKKIIEIMARHGFRWGGYYHDYMHFEYTLDHILDVPGAGKAFFFPLDLGKGYEKSEENIEEYYKHTEVDHAGGFFPLGANTVWHGGVHIHTEHRALIKAMYDGEIIGGKLAFENEKANGDYGSHNFLIVKHTVTGKSLNAQFGAAGDASESDQNSKQEKTTVKKGDNLQALASTWNTTVDAIRKANPNLEDHYGESGGTSWYWAGDVVVRPVAAQQEPRRHSDSFDDDESKTFYSIYMHLNNEELDPEKNEKHREISWLPERIDSYTVKENVNIRKDTHFEETLIGTLKTGDTLKPVSQEKIKNKNGYDWLHVKVTSGNLKGKTGYVANSGSVADNIEAVMEIDPALLEKLESGDIVKIDHVKVCAGDVLWTVGKYGSDPVPLLHWEVFSEENLFPSFEKVEDDDQDFTMDCDKVFKLVNQNTGYWSDDDNLEADEVYSFYKEQSEKSTSLRKYACKFTPEWAVNLDVAIDNMKGRWYTWGLKEKLEPYVWWERAVSAGIDIPKKKPLWFYNPVSFLETLQVTAGGHTVQEKNNEQSDIDGLTVEQVKEIAKFASLDNIKKHINGINEAIREFKIDTIEKKAHFLAQLITESGSFRYTKELGVSNDSYGGFIGRGLIQLTFKTNYEAYGNFVGEDFVSSESNKEKLEKDPHAAKSAGWYWAESAKLNDDAQRNDFIDIVRSVNGGYNGYDHRYEALKCAIEVLDKNKTISTNYEFSKSKTYHDLKGSFGWGVWHDPNTSKKGCKKDKVKAKEGYKRFITLHDQKGKPEIKNDWYGYKRAGIRKFVEDRIKAL